MTLPGHETKVPLPATPEIRISEIPAVQTLT